MKYQLVERERAETGRSLDPNPNPDPNPSPDPSLYEEIDLENNFGSI